MSSIYNNRFRKKSVSKSVSDDSNSPRDFNPSELVAAEQFFADQGNGNKFDDIVQEFQQFVKSTNNTLKTLHQNQSMFSDNGNQRARDQAAWHLNQLSAVTQAPSTYDDTNDNYPPMRFGRHS